MARAWMSPGREVVAIGAQHPDRQRCPALAVLGQGDRSSAIVGLPLVVPQPVSPLHQRDDDRKKIGALGGQQVLHAGALTLLAIGLLLEFGTRSLRRVATTASVAPTPPTNCPNRLTP